MVVASAALRPRDAVWLAAVAIFPGAAAFVVGVPKVARPGPRGIMAIFHLVVYPVLAMLTIGLPAVLIAYLLAGVLPGSA